jgi:hypothetical protein
VTRAPPSRAAPRGLWTPPRSRSSRGLGHQPFTLAARVRIPYGTPGGEVFCGFAAFERSASPNQPTNELGMGASSGAVAFNKRRLSGGFRLKRTAAAAVPTRRCARSHFLSARSHLWKAGWSDLNQPSWRTETWRCRACLTPSPSPCPCRVRPNSLASRAAGSTTRPRPGTSGLSCKSARGTDADRQPTPLILPKM